MAPWQSEHYISMHSLEGKRVYLKFENGKGGEGDFRIVLIEGGLMKVRPLDPDTDEEMDPFWFPIAHIFTIRERTDPKSTGIFKDDVMDAWSRLGLEPDQTKSEGT